MDQKMKLNRHTKSRIRDTKRKIIDEYLTSKFCYIDKSSIIDKTAPNLIDRYDKIWYTNNPNNIRGFIASNKKGVSGIRSTYSEYATESNYESYIHHADIISKLDDLEKKSILPQIRNQYIEKCYDILVHNPIRSMETVKKMLLCADEFYRTFSQAENEVHKVYNSRELCTYNQLVKLRKIN